jgi:hypothetical protein
MSRFILTTDPVEAYDEAVVRCKDANQQLAKTWPEQDGSYNYLCLPIEVAIQAQATGDEVCKSMMRPEVGQYMGNTSCYVFDLHPSRPIPNK